MIKNIRFAGFIMTYNRGSILESTITQIFEQTFPPEKILVIDNSSDNITKNLIENLNHSKVFYHSAGYNSGPAGAAKIGLEILANEGYDWIYWGDDDDPPLFKDEFQKLLLMARSLKNVGAIGSVGAKFNYNTGLKERFKDKECRGILECDSIGGNHNLIINAKAVLETGIFPNPDLFFGFEEFEFLQRLKFKGYRIIASGESLLKHRIHNDRLNIESTRSIVPKKNIPALKRDYYSYRNLIYTLHFTFKEKNLGFKISSRALMKIPFGYLKGFQYGNLNFKYMVNAVVHSYQKKLGKTY